jgi:hypothetical protein
LIIIAGYYLLNTYQGLQQFASNPLLSTELQSRGSLNQAIKALESLVWSPISTSFFIIIAHLLVRKYANQSINTVPVFVLLVVFGWINAELTYTEKFQDLLQTILFSTKIRTETLADPLVYNAMSQLSQYNFVGLCILNLAFIVLILAQIYQLVPTIQAILQKLSFQIISPLTKRLSQISGVILIATLALFSYYQVQVHSLYQQLFVNVHAFQDVTMLGYSVSTSTDYSQATTFNWYFVLISIALIAILVRSRLQGQNPSSKQTLFAIFINIFLGFITSLPIAQHLSGYFDNLWQISRAFDEQNLVTQISNSGTQIYQLYVVSYSLLFSASIIFVVALWINYQAHSSDHNANTTQHLTTVA